MRRVSWREIAVWVLLFGQHDTPQRQVIVLTGELSAEVGESSETKAPPGVQECLRVTDTEWLCWAEYQGHRWLELCTATKCEVML